MQLLTVVLGRPGTIGFATGLAHPRAPNLWGKQGWYTGQGIIAWDLTHGNYGSTTWTDSFVDSLLGGCVANFTQEVVKGELPLSVRGIRRPGSRTVRPQCGPRLPPLLPSVF